MDQITPTATATTLRASRDELLAGCSTVIAPDTFLSRSAVAAKIGTSVRTLDRWAVDGNGPPMIALGRRRVYRWGDVLAWLETQKIAHTAALSAGARGKQAA